MNKIFAGGLLAATALAGAPVAAADLETTMGPILATAPDAATLDRKCDVYMTEIARRQSELEKETGPATIGRTLVRYDEINGLFGAGFGEFGMYQQVMADQPRRDSGANCQVRLSTLQSKISLSRPIYLRLKAIPQTGLDEATSWYLTRTLQSFERSGVNLPAAKRAQVQTLNEQIAKLGTDFDNNLANGRKIVKARSEELKGLPADFIAAHKPGADGLIEISTDTPDYEPVMAYAESDDLRKRMSVAFNQRAYPVNDAVLKQLFSKRAQLAHLVGRRNYATLVLEDKMLNTPAKVQKLLADMDAAAAPAADRDYAKMLQVLRETQPGAKQVEFWQNAWLGQKVKQRFYSYDSQEARQYFAYNNVRDGILKLTEDMFGVQIRPWNTPKWDPLVEAYEMLDHGKVIGRFYFDAHPRPGKYGHADTIALRPGIGDEPPVGVLVMNFPAGGHDTGLMEHDQVQTFLHEYGHLLHGIFGGHTRWLGESGVSTEWDFVEAPSQMLENWVYDYDTLAKFAVNAKGQTIPRDLVARMNKARYFKLGVDDTRQLGLANISLQFHQKPVPADLGLAARTWHNQYAKIDEPPFVQMQDSFTHLNGYSAVYYTYRWSIVIADDLYTRWEREGLTNRQTAAAYRKAVLEPGGSKPAAELVRDFLGRDIGLAAYRAKMAKDQ